MVFSKLVASTILYSSILVFCIYIYMCVFPLLEDKIRFKLVGVMSILNTYFIPMFSLGFSSFIR